MDINKENKLNPLKMRQLSLGDKDIFVLPSTHCSSRRVEFLRRGNTTIGFYCTMSMVSKTGYDVIAKKEEQGEFKDDTRFRLDMGVEGGVHVMNYGLFKKLFAQAGTHLTNQAFLMLYGSFEAYVADLVMDAFVQMGTEPDPYERTLELLAQTKWQGKIDRMCVKLKVPLGKGVFATAFKDIDMGFLGEPCKGPIEFLEKVAEVRHRLVHSSGRVDSAFLAAHPNAGLTIGQIISLQFGSPTQMQLYFSHMSGIFDEAFSSTFGWQRTLVAPEDLTG